MKVARILNEILRTRLRRILFLLVALAFLATIVPAGPRPAPNVRPARAVMTVVAVPLDGQAPLRRRVGDLLFLRGWALSSPEPRFGGVSAMHVEGGRVTALSDAGVVMEFALPSRAGSQPVLIRPLSIAAGRNKKSRDTESLVVQGSEAWVGFEYFHAIRRFGRAGWALESIARPQAMRGWLRNSGAEAMLRLPDGRFLVFSEGRDNRDSFSPVLLFEGDPAMPGTRAVELRYRRPAGFRVTDADLLPDGRLLLVNRRFRLLEGFSASLVLADLPALRAGAIIAGREIAVLADPLTHDNMEALSVAREGGRTIVRIASDDNFMPIQRTLLLEFALVESKNGS